MDILLISECFLIVALIVFLIATLRIITYKSISMGLIGTSSFTLALTLLLIAVGTIFNIGYHRVSKYANFVKQYSFKNLWKCGKTLKNQYIPKNFS